MKLSTVLATYIQLTVYIIFWRGSRFLEEGFRWHPPLENFEISSPRKISAILRQSQRVLISHLSFKNGSNLVMSLKSLGMTVPLR